MSIDDNQSVQEHFLEQKKYLRQNEVVAKLGMQLTRAVSMNSALESLLQSMTRELEYLYASVTVLRTGDEIKLESAAESSIGAVLEATLSGLETQAQQAMTFKMAPIKNKLEVNHSLFKVRRSYDCFAVSKPIVFSGQVLGAITGVKANVGAMNPKAEQSLLTLIANLLAQALIIEKSGTGLTLSKKRPKSDAFDSTGIVGNSKQLTALFDVIRRVAFTETVVFLQGESGIGKGIFAKCIHNNSGRYSKSFVKFNGSTMDEVSVEKALFGGDDNQGVIRQAEKGTLFIDAVESLSLKTQSKLLRLAKDRQFEPLGSNQTMRADVRLIVSSTEKLEELVKKGCFSSDLYYYIATFPIIIPSLKDRKSDIIPLADHFIEKYTFMHNKKVSRISTPAIDMLSSYHWPGNVRELEGCIERAVLLTNESVIRGHHLPPSLQKVSNTSQSRGIDLRRHLDSVEKELILDALKDAKGNMAKAARFLGLTERVMGLRVNGHGINVKKFKSQNT